LVLVMAAGLGLMAFSRHRLGHIAAILLLSGAILYATIGWTIAAKAGGSEANEVQRNAGA